MEWQYLGRGFFYGPHQKYVVCGDNREKKNLQDQEVWITVCLTLNTKEKNIDFYLTSL